MFDVIVCGSLHLDIMVKAPRLPGLDETLAGTDWGQQCGGKGGNQAVMAARMGVRTAMIGRVGNDPFGERLVDNLHHAGVDTRAVGIDPEHGSGMSVAVVDPKGEYGAIIVSGANLAIPPDEMFDVWHALEGGRVLVLQNEIPEAVNIQIAKVARRVGAKVVVNAAPARAMSEEFLDLIDVLVVNRVEAAMLTGRPVDTSQELRSALTWLGEGRRGVIITLGSKGLVGATAAGLSFDIPAVPVEVKSTHGAGDAFIGALVARLVRFDPLAEAARAANAAAAMHVAGTLTEEA